MAFITHAGGSGSAAMREGRPSATRQRCSHDGPYRPTNQSGVSYASSSITESNVTKI